MKECDSQDLKKRILCTKQERIFPKFCSGSRGITYNNGKLKRVSQGTHLPFCCASVSHVSTDLCIRGVHLRDQILILLRINDGKHFWRARFVCLQLL